MTDDELIDLGQAAEIMLANPSFQTLLDLALRRFGEQFQVLPFERRNELNDLHLAKCGLDHFVRHLGQLKALKDKIEADREYENNQPSNLADE